MARKWDLVRAVTLFKKHMEVYTQRKLLLIDPGDDGVLTQLYSGKFVVPGTTDREGAMLVIFNAALHVPVKAEFRANLEAIVFLLSAVTDNITTQRNGVTFIFNMTKSSWSNQDYALTKTMLQILQNAFPGRLRKALLLNCPWWLKTSIKAFTSLMKAKAGEKMQIVSSLDAEVDPRAVPVTSGGLRPYDATIHRKVIGKIIAGRQTLLRGASRRRVATMDGARPPRSVGPPARSNNVAQPTGGTGRRATDGGATAMRPGRVGQDGGSRPGVGASEAPQVPQRSRPPSTAIASPAVPPRLPSAIKTDDGAPERDDNAWNPFSSALPPGPSTNKRRSPTALTRSEFLVFTASLQTDPGQLIDHFSQLQMAE